MLGDMGSADNDMEFQAVRSIILVLVETDPVAISREASWDDAGVGRYDLFGILKEVERHFGIRVLDDDAFEMNTVGDLVSFLERARR